MAYSPVARPETVEYGVNGETFHLLVPDFLTSGNRFPMCCRLDCLTE